MSTQNNVLVVDDNIDAADMTASILQAYGVNARVAYGGVEALAAARASRPGLIFLDLGMPIMDGFQVARAVRADETLHDIKLVALTAWGDANSRSKAAAAGFDMLLTKPASINEIIALAGVSTQA